MLILNFDDESLKVPVNGKILVGSEEDSDIFIENSNVAPRHAEISAGPNGECRISDLGSAQGTFVNGRRVKSKRLEPGDELRFGPVKARFVGWQSARQQPPREEASPAHASGTSAPASAAPNSKAPKPEPEPKTSEARAHKPPADPKAGSDRTTSPEVRPATAPESAGNQRRPNLLMRLFVALALLNATLFTACAVWFYVQTKSDLAERLESHAATGHPGHPAAPAVPPPVADSKTATRMDGMNQKLAAVESSLTDLRTRIAATEERSGETSRRIAEVAALIEELKRDATRKDPAPVPPVAGDPAMPASQAELVLIKERNRLTSFADEAIATGAREPYERLWDAIEDPHLANLIHATRAEILRVQDCYINGQRVKFYGIQQHQIPVAEIFPDSAALAPAQLSDDQLIQVLGDLKQSWQTRVKAAWHLGQRRSTKVGDALVKAIKSDPVLDVVAEATFSFEQISGYHAKLFDVAPLEAWWKSYNEKPVPQKIGPKAPAQGKAAEHKSKAE
jgi:pSer/pThr/pTyr-binding forkhead associated (FHA) protein